MTAEENVSVSLSQKINKYGKFSLAHGGISLGWAGIVTGAIIIVSAIEMILKSSEFILGGLVVVLVSCFLIDFSLKLLETVWADDVGGLMALLKRACYTVACLEVTACLDGLLSLCSSETDSLQKVATILKWGPPLVFIALMVWGVKKSLTEFMQIYISFKLLHFTFAVLAERVIVAASGGETAYLALELMKILFIGFLYLFSSGFTILYYIILNIQNPDTDHSDDLV